MRRLLLPLLLAASTAVPASAALPVADAAAAKSKVRFGIADQAPAMFSDARWAAMGLKLTRYNVPWDAMSDEGALDRADAFVEAAREQGVEVLMHLTGRIYDGEVEALPSRAEYRTAVRALVKRYRPLGVRTWGTWNEANHSTQPTNHRPDRAAEFFLELRSACSGCSIVAVDLLTQGGPRSDGLSSYRGYLRRFYAKLGTKRSLVKIVGIHNYGELVLSKGTVISRDLTRFARRYSPATRFWITETGGLAASRTRSCSESRQVTGTTRMFSHAISLAKYGVDRLYMYNWTADDCDDLFDSGLIRRDGTARPALAAIVKGSRTLSR